MSLREQLPEAEQETALSALILTFMLDGDLQRNEHKQLRSVIDICTIKGQLLPQSLMRPYSPPQREATLLL